MTTCNHDHEDWLEKAKQADVIVFDLDGTLISSNIANFLSYQAAISHVLSSEISLLEIDRNIRITREVLGRLIPNISNKKVAQIVAEKERIYEQYLPTTILNDKLAYIIERLKDKELILATNGRKSRANMLLDHHKLSNKFSRKIYKDTFRKSDKYAQFLPNLLEENKSILIFENDMNAIKSAASYGIKCDQIINICETPICENF
jgi:phosphoglycolate phosphatase-like HAD superfamily hydrolase